MHIHRQTFTLIQTQTRYGNLQAYKAMKLSSHTFSALIVLGRFYHPVKFWG